MAYIYDMNLFFDRDKDVRRLKWNYQIEELNRGYETYREASGIPNIGTYEGRNTYAFVQMLAQGHSLDTICQIGYPQEEERENQRLKADIRLVDLNSESYYNRYDAVRDNKPQRTDQIKELADLYANAGKTLWDTPFPDLQNLTPERWKESHAKLALLSELMKSYEFQVIGNHKIQEFNPDLKERTRNIASATNYIDRLCQYMEYGDLDRTKYTVINDLASEMGNDLQGKTIAQCLEQGLFRRAEAFMSAVEGLHVEVEDMILGAHPYGMTAKEREEKAEELRQKQRVIGEKYEIAKERMARYLHTAEQSDGLDAEEIAMAADKIHYTEPSLRRLQQQYNSVTNRLNLIESVEKTEQKVQEPRKGMAFTTDARFSPQLKEAILTQGILSEAAYDGMKVVADKYGYRQGRDEDKAIDLRDFHDMIAFDPWTSKEEVEARGRAFAEDYMCGDPMRRKAALDDFYDRIDAIDPLSLDLSCLTGNDMGERTEPGMLTTSERDFLKLVTLSRASQTIATKANENPGYLEQRYPTKEARLRYDLTQDLFILHGMLGYMNIGVYPNNQIDQGLHVVEGETMVFPNTALAPGIALQAYQQNMATLLGKQCDHKLSFTVPGNMADTWYRYSRQNARGNEADSSLHFEDTLGVIFRSSASRSYMQESGLTMEDMIFIDGQSLREKMDREHPEMNVEQRSALAKDAAMRAMVSGEHRVELATVQTNEKGAYTIQVATIQPDLHALDQMERDREHSQARRAFDFGLTKIETRADRIDKLWKDDPKRETRQKGIVDNVNKQIIAVINEKERQKAQAAAEARRLEDAKPVRESVKLSFSDFAREDKMEKEQIRAGKVKEKFTEKVKEPMKEELGKKELVKKDPQKK